VKTQRYYSHGKLLLTGEYLVLDGAKALAIPCKYGQHLEVSSTTANKSSWHSYDYQDKLWFSAEFNLAEVITHKVKGENEIEQRLFQILREAYQLNSKIFHQNYNFKTELEFPQNWGLGTSSTLITNFAQWADVDAYRLLYNTFGGSGYDIACAQANSALSFRLKQDAPEAQNIDFPEALIPFTYFLHLGKKQNSRSAIKNYRAQKPSDLETKVEEINKLSEAFLKVTSFQEGQNVLKQHELLLSEILKLNPIQSREFPDFDGQIKSLGAWGGDFVLVLSQTNPRDYFNEKGYATLLTFQDMVL